MRIERQPWFKCYFVLASMLIFIPIITMASGDSKISNIDTPAFILTVFAIRKMMAPEEGTIYNFDLYLAWVVWCFGAVKMVLVTCQLYRPEKDFLMLKRGGRRIIKIAIEVGCALRGKGESV